MDFEIPYCIGEEDATIFVMNYDGQKFDYDVTVKDCVVELDKKKDLEVFRFIEQYIVDKNINYVEWLDDGYYDELSEVE